MPGAYKHTNEQISRPQIQATIPESVQIPRYHLPSTSASTHSGDDEQHFTVAPPPPSIELTPLLGHPPSSTLYTYYNLLASQLSTLVWLSEEGPEGGNLGGAVRRPIVVGLALKRRQGDDNDGLGGSIVDNESLMEKQYRGIVNAVQSLL